MARSACCSRIRTRPSSHARSSRWISRVAASGRAASAGSILRIPRRRPLPPDGGDRRMSNSSTRRYRRSRDRHAVSRGKRYGRWAPDGVFRHGDPGRGAALRRRAPDFRRSAVESCSRCRSAQVPLSFVEASPYIASRSSERAEYAQAYRLERASGRRVERLGRECRAHARHSRSGCDGGPLPHVRTCRRADAQAPREHGRRAFGRSRGLDPLCRLGGGWHAVAGHLAGARPADSDFRTADCFRRSTGLESSSIN